MALMQNGTLRSYILRAGIIALLIVSLLVIILPARGGWTFITPLLFSSLGIAITVITIFWERQFRKQSPIPAMAGNRQFRNMLIWYLLYAVFLETLAYIGYRYGTVQAGPFVLSADLFLILSAVPLAGALAYPWLASVIGTARQADRPFESGIIADCRAFYRRHRSVWLLVCLLNLIALTLVVLVFTGSSDRDTIGWTNETPFFGSLLLVTLLTIDAAVAMLVMSGE